MIVPAAQLKKIEDCLNNIQAELHATSILLLDQSGQVLASRNQRGGLPTTALGALLSGTFYSSREVAKALKEEEFKSLYQQGPRESIHAELVGEQWILAIIFRKPTLLGMVRVVSRRSVVRLAQILEETKAVNQQSGRWSQDKPNDGMAEFEDNIQNIFKE